MDWFVFWVNVKENLNWIIPSITSLFFALVTTILILKQAKWQKNERKINVDMMIHQNNLQEAQLCIDLAEKRLMLFQAITEAIRDVIRNDEADLQMFQKYRADTFGVEFYFGEDVLRFHKKIDTMLYDLAYISMKVNDVLEGRKEHANHSENVDKQSEMVSEFLNISNELFSVFKPYLGFSDYKIRE